METVRIRYGNTNTFLVGGRLLVDTDYAGKMREFFKALKAANIRLDSITHVMATHYHPDHCGLIGELQQRGIKIILLESQKNLAHFADYIFERDRLEYIPIDENEAELVCFENSRDYLCSLGIAGEVISTPSHSEDSISLILDNGDCIVGDLQRKEYIDICEDNTALKTDWDHIMKHHPKRVLYAHEPERRMA